MGLTGATDQWNKAAAAAQGQAQANVLGDAIDIGAAPFTGGLSLAGLNLNPMGTASASPASSNGQTATSGGTNTGLNLSALFNGLGNFMRGSPSNVAASSSITPTMFSGTSGISGLFA